MTVRVAELNADRNRDGALAFKATPVTNKCSQKRIPFRAVHYVQPVIAICLLMQKSEIPSFFMGFMLKNLTIPDREHSLPERSVCKQHTLNRI